MNKETKQKRLEKLEQQCREIRRMIEANTKPTVKINLNDNE